MNKVIDHLRRVLKRHEAAGTPDGDLLRRYVKERDEAAFEALVRKHGPMVFGVCRRVLGNPHDAEDAFQATFLVLVRKAATLRSPGMIGNWLYGVAYRTALHARNAAVKRRAKEAEVPERIQTPEDTWADLRPILDQELQRLADKYRVLVVLCDLEGRSRREVAKLLGLPEGTVASRLTTARTMLAKRLKGRGLLVTGGSIAGALSAETASAGLPAFLLAATVKAASLCAAGPAAAGAISAHVVALTEGVLKTMLITKLKSMAIVFVAGSLIAATTAAVAFHGTGVEQTGDKQGQGGKSSPLAKNHHDSTTVIPAQNPYAAGNTVVTVKNQQLEKDLKQVTATLEQVQAELQLVKKQVQQLDAALQAQSSITNPQQKLPVTGTNPKKKPPEKAAEDMTINLFSVHDVGEYDGQNLVQVIINTVEPNSWNQLGGRGSIEYLPGTKGLVIKNSKEVLATVGALLAKMRDNRQKQVDQEQKIKEISSALTIVKLYPLPGLAEKDGMALVQVITKTLEPIRWGSESGGSIEYFAEGQTLVVRHSADMQARVQAFLEELRKLKEKQVKK